MGSVIIKPQHTLAYKILSGPPKTPIAAPLKIDRLAITLDIPTIEERKSISTKLKKMKEGEAYATWAKRGGYKHGYSIFVDEYGIDLSTDQACFRVHTDPWYGTHNYMRVEFNPSKTPSYMIKPHLDILLNDGYSRLMKGGRVTILHEAIDVHFCELKELYFYFPKIHCSTLNFKGGGIISTYMGKHTSQKQFSIYNKTQEIKDTKKNFYHDYISNAFKKTPVPPYQIMRIELRQDFKKKTMSFSETKHLPNLFSKLKIFNRVSYDAPSGLKNGFEKSYFSLFVDSCNAMGLQQARLKLPPKWRKKFDSIMMESKVNWWNPITVPSEREALIDKITKPIAAPHKHIKFFSVLKAYCN